MHKRLTRFYSKSTKSSFINSRFIMLKTYNNVVVRMQNNGHSKGTIQGNIVQSKSTSRAAPNVTMAKKQAITGKKQPKKEDNCGQNPTTSGQYRPRILDKKAKSWPFLQLNLHRLSIIFSICLALLPQVVSNDGWLPGICALVLLGHINFC